MAWYNPRTWFRPVARSITGETFAGGAFADLCAPAGIKLTATEALGVGAVYCADRVISEDLASFPIRVYDGDGEDAKPIPGDPVARLLNKPNPEQTGPVFWSAYQHNANLWGFAAAEIVRDGRGRPVELWLIPSPEWRLGRDGGGRLTFTTNGAGGGEETFDPADVLFLPGFSPDGSAGFKLLQVARLALGSAAAVQHFAAARFKNGIKPSGGIKHPGILGEQARNNMRASWSALYGGPTAAGVPMIFEEGVEWVPFEIAHNDQLQLTQLAEFYVTEVARFFNISPTKLHQLGRATWANLETLNREHVHSCLGPWLVKHAAEIAAKLLGDGRTARHVTDRLLQADTNTRFDAWSKGIAGGFLVPNEARRFEDLPPMPGGDKLLRPVNLAPADQPPPPPPPPAPPAEVPTDGSNPPGDAG